MDQTFQSQILSAFDVVDRKDAEAFGALFEDDARFEFANLPSQVGPQAIHAFCADFFASIQSLRHEVTAYFDGGTVPAPSAMLRGYVHYVRLDGRPVSVPFANAFELGPNGRFRLWKIYADTTPLYAPAEG